MTVRFSTAARRCRRDEGRELHLLDSTRSAEVSHETACASGDPELAEWALDAWHRTARQELTFAAATEDHARIRIYWASGRMRLYGEARPVEVDGKRGAAIYVNPDVTQPGEEIDLAAERDPLLRQPLSISPASTKGHALSLSHTGKFETLCQLSSGGDIVEYFERYRRRIEQDIRGGQPSRLRSPALLGLFRKHP